ncbi:hypothetical protein Dda_3876 [Drechslerella dactyloides]|uniref:Uncharacterized protein n=1 Tax=Drechslerella dactyloides TaxID=74499 RepID=A0AAD6IYQ5_DREDA|nr:hypothetical protein Dda_3876 [Drechslerella dactyloides]
MDLPPLQFSIGPDSGDMDYLLACESPSEVCYIKYLQAYAEGCHILNLPFVERIAKIDFECMIRKRFLNLAAQEDLDEDDTIKNAVLAAAYIPLMPAWFFERKPVTQASSIRKRNHLRATHAQVCIPTTSAPAKIAADQQTCTHAAAATGANSISSPSNLNPNPPRGRHLGQVPIGKRACSRTAFSASYRYAASLYTAEDDRPVYVAKSIWLQIPADSSGWGDRSRDC